MLTFMNHQLVFTEKCLIATNFVTLELQLSRMNVGLVRSPTRPCAVPLSTVGANEESIYGHIRIRVCHPITVSGKMCFPMLSQDRFVLEFFATAFKGADVFDVRVLLMFTHKIFTLKRQLTFFHRTEDL